MITYKIATHDDYYGDCPEGTDFDAWAENIGEKATAWMKGNFPDVEFEYELVLETFSHGGKSSAGDDDEEGILAALDNYVGNNWPDWYPE